jgi:hypothetical protein
VAAHAVVASKIAASSIEDRRHLRNSKTRGVRGIGRAGLQCGFPRSETASLLGVLQVLVSEAAGSQPSDIVCSPGSEIASHQKALATDPNGTPREMLQT